MELEKIKLSGLQEIQSINIEPADNGGCVVRYTVYTPSKKNNESGWDNHTELFDETEIELALDRIKELYKANLENKKSGYAEVSSPKAG